VTLVVTAVVVALCYWIRHHYEEAGRNLRQLDEVMADLPVTPHAAPPPLDPAKPVAVVLVGSYGGLGLHTMLDALRLFPSQFRQVLFVSAAVVDAATMKGVEEVDRVVAEAEAGAKRFVETARGLGIPADYRTGVGTDAAEALETMCAKVAREFRRAVFFASRVVFEDERWYQRFLHNDTAHEIQRRLQFLGLQTVVLPVRVFKPRAA